MLRSIAAQFAASAIVLFARLVTAVRGIWFGADPVNRQRVYFANHGSNGDFVLIWTVLPPVLRAKTRPVAGSDYWLTSKLKTFIGRDVFNAVLIDRNPDTRTEDPIAQMVEALDGGASLILFPEGTRNLTDDPLLPFKPGLFHLAEARPEVELVPTWIDNLTSVMPKGEVIPVPLLCSVTFGTPLTIQKGENKATFLTRAQSALAELAEEAAT
ncbi:1-acyl-sn-glycerol-3-phosphate acyltransferase [Aliiroseovarius halocynthiae]|uniref:1-acyl-sn-glycerol-3-phosphate acyltransferase n=1 Tax=Aliiroseovarius halocynthiae TaxID=985055 RepID=A0A545SZK8_9RHOB|nr:lysophospholipid acyltransferase family protein [Aliiroseovarius halocynthiae]TQV70403.1 1-acyl-sn-glycerol-3-phosphate acyltransferase [Aliiroseovarius halocynthiae]SMR81880.1 1-acyl-sn-glycerol-3-phosphate acyltransferase [Aliiroseovarius halocynthiae]